MEINKTAMKKCRIYCFFLIIILFSLICCTNHSASSTGVWNELTSTFTIEEENISYTLPTETSSWLIAQKETMPSNMLFFGVDRNEDICIGIFDPKLKSENSKKIEELSGDEVEVIVLQLSNSDQNQSVVFEKIDKKKEVFDGHEVWNYVLERKVKDYEMSDTISIYYSGFIFNALKKPYGIVMISGFNPTDSIGKISYLRYISKLNIPKEK